MVTERIKEMLIERARQAKAKAYAPYSRYSVGSALLTGEDEIFEGCNVENVSYGLSICAERSAVFQAIAQGKRKPGEKMAIRAIAVITQDTGFPCGACLQVINEFAPDPKNLIVLLSNEQGNQQEYALSELFPHPFGG